MLPVRRSPDRSSNDDFKEDPKDDDPKKEARLREARLKISNLEWIQLMREEDEKARKEKGAEKAEPKPKPFCQPNDVILLGGASLADFRIRVAQSHARHDMTPSYWSLVGVISGPNRLVTAPLWPLDKPSMLPLSNGIRSLPLSDFDDQELWPNIAVMSFPGRQRSAVLNIGKLRARRSVVDIPSLILQWLGFVWGAGGTGNPLLAGYGVPSAVLVEAAFGMAEVELTPGLAAASSCPEAIYQAAKWWTGYYQDVAGYDAARRSPGGAKPNADINPKGHYLLRQLQATYVEPEP
jgi:hypothetical protein